jgi:hypothetical protein
LAKITENREENGQKCFENLKKKKQKRSFSSHGRVKKTVPKYVIFEIYELRVYSEKLDTVGENATKPR